MKTRSRRSQVWRHFKKVHDNKAVLCGICKKEFKFHGNTSNLQQHLKRLHRTLYLGTTNKGEYNLDSPSSSGSSAQLNIDSITKSEFNSNDPSGSESFTQETSELNEIQVKHKCEDMVVSVAPKCQCELKLMTDREQSQLSQERIYELDDCVTLMLAEDFQPISIVQNKGFIKFCNKLLPSYNLPSCYTLTTKLLPRLYNQKASALRNVLNSVCHVALTTDIWSSANQNYFITITVHYVYENIVHCSVLNTVGIEQYTGENIATITAEVLDNWNIKDKVVIVVTNDGSNMKEAVKDILKMYHHPCVAHTLNMCVADGIENNIDFENLIQKCKALFKSIRSTEENQNHNDSEIKASFREINLKHDMLTRWDSSLLLLETLLQIKPSLCSADASILLTVSEWDLVEDYAVILKPMSKMTVHLSAEHYPTMSLVIPLVRGLQHGLQKLKPKTNEGRTLQTLLFDAVSQRLTYLESNKIVATTTLLDPRFKTAAFGLPENANNAKEWLTKDLNAMRQKDISNQNVQSNYEAQATQDSSENSLWSFFDDQLKFSTSSVMCNRQTIEMMINEYVSLPYVSRLNNPFDFWQENKHAFPDLYKLALKYLCIPAVAAPSERIFSKAGREINERRSRLPVEYLDELLFLNSNFSL